MPRAQRLGRVHSLWALLLACGVLTAVLILLLKLGGPGHDESTRKLSVYCAAGLRVPVEEISRRYEQEFGIKIALQFGGSNSLLNQIEVNKFDTGDLFLAADQHYVDLARQKGLAAECLPAARQRPVIAVRKGNPKQIARVQDLLSDQVKVALADPEQAAVGRAAQKALEKIAVGDSNRWKQLQQHVVASGVFKPTVNDVASDIKLGSVDAGIIWNSTAAMPGYREQLEIVTAPELEDESELVSVCVLNASRQPTAALKLARYLTASDRGLPVFEEYGLDPVDGDEWEEQPKITFFCGSVNRRSVAPIIADFEQREDVQVNAIYNGCGILTSQMKTIVGQEPDRGFPDVYMACDVYYLDNVKEWFQEAVDISDADIVLAVPKGSTRVKTLADLVKPGIRVAVGEPDQCTIGALTRRLLVKEALYDQLKAKQKQPGEVVVEKSSSAQLVPDVVTGHVDAAVAYITDVQANLDTVDVVRFESPLNLAVQPLSIAKTSRHKYLIRRLYEKVENSPQAFENAGFHFRLKKDAGAK